MPATKSKTKAKGGAPKGNKNAVGNKGGRPTAYKCEDTCRVVREMATLGARDEDMARGLGIGLTTYHVWRTTHVEFAEAIRMGKQVIDSAVERALVQNALGYSYDTEKVFQNGMRVKVVEHVAPSVKAQEIWLRNRMPEVYRERKETEPTITVHDWLRASLEEMSEKSKLRRAERAKLIEQERTKVD